MSKIEKRRITKTKLKTLNKSAEIINLAFNLYLEDTLSLSLITAVNSNNEELVVELLEKGADVNYADKFKRTPLHLAVSRNYVSIVRILLNYGADLSLQDSLGNTPLHLASCTGNVTIVKDLLARGADAKSKDMRGVSPVQLAQGRLRLLASCCRATTTPDQGVHLREQVQAIVENLLASMEKSQAELVEALNQRVINLEPKDQISALLHELENLSL